MSIVDLAKKKQHRCPTCGQSTEKRSWSQLKLYWSLLHEISEKVKPSGQAYSAEVWHTYWKQRLLGAEELRLPNGKTISITRSTTTLDKEEMTDYLTKIEQFAAERGVFTDG